MIIRQYQDVIDGRKTQTRRLIDPKLTLLDSTTGFRRIDSPLPTGTVVNAIGITGNDSKYRTRWQVGKVYAIVPKMGKPGVGFYRITSLRVERLQDISEADAIAEGILPFVQLDLSMGYTCRGLDAAYPTARDCYQALWESINGAYKGARWTDNPTVAVITIECVQGK